MKRRIFLLLATAGLSLLFVGCSKFRSGPTIIGIWKVQEHDANAQAYAMVFTSERQGLFKFSDSASGPAFTYAFTWDLIDDHDGVIHHPQGTHPFQYNVDGDTLTLAVDFGISGFAHYKCIRVSVLPSPPVQVSPTGVR